MTSRDRHIIHLSFIAVLYGFGENTNDLIHEKVSKLVNFTTPNICLITSPAYNQFLMLEVSPLAFLLSLIDNYRSAKQEDVIHLI